MGAFQLGYIDTMGDPFFAEGTLRVITSDISKSFPVSDASLGAFAYTLDVILACHGGSKRWVEHPWIVVVFGLLVIPLGVVSIVLMILQPVIIHTWCTLCLFAVFFMLMLVAFTLDEIAAVIQLFAKVRKEKKSLWKILWKGEKAENYGVVKAVSSKLFDGVSATPWLIGAALVAVWLLASPQVLGLSGDFVASYYILGSLSLAISLISMAEPFRVLRYLNFVIALLLFVFSGLAFHGILPALLLAILSFPRGKVEGRYGIFSKIIF